jgi:FSR family fosmidomycin resistance protein-like MFS transporter
MAPQLDSPRRTALEAALLGLAHAVVDAASAYLLFKDLADFSPEKMTTLILLYDALAFAGQIPLGLALDRWRAPRAFGATGIALAIAALVVAPLLPLVGVVIIGVGNALFHLGAGAHVLARSGDRAAESGIFVGPGAVGLFAGIWLGTHGAAWHTPLVVLLGACLVPTLLLIRRPSLSLSAKSYETPSEGRRLAMIALGASCLLASVAVRSVAGTLAGDAWRGIDATVVASLALAACAGKALGGLLADWLGWALTSALALAGAALLLGLELGSPVGAIVGMLLLQSTMPVTLKATHLLIPDRPGLAFGLPCGALLLGSLVALLPLTILSSPTFLLGQLLASGALVVAGLRCVRRQNLEYARGA